MEIRIQAGAVSFKLTGNSPKEARQKANQMMEAFKGFPGFSLDADDKHKKVKEKDTRPIGTRAEILAYIASFKEGHAVRYLEKNCPYSNCTKRINEMLKVNILVLAETLYQGKKHMQTMQAVYLSGNEPQLPSAFVDKRWVAHWVRDNPEYSVKYVEEHCGVVRSRAKEALTALLLEGTLKIKTLESGDKVVTTKED